MEEIKTVVMICKDFRNPWQEILCFGCIYIDG